ncbi:hypothetical protein [Ruegeria lacuscaerulensis]|uniref:hypothetical protein n=1 Tax=Ruegeria lacuscaerulensis TaxID=55218 RepID=UPI00147C1447|nr:hypothetical protein [Ruegeria lacuscaerulensis]
MDEALRLLNVTLGDILKGLDKTTGALKVKSVDYNQMLQQLDHCKRYPWKYLVGAIKLRLPGEKT